MHEATVVDCDSGEQFNLVSLSLDETLLRERLSALGLLVASVSRARFREESLAYEGSNRGEICGRTVYRPRTPVEFARMAAAVLLVPAAHLAWCDRHFLLQNLVESLQRDSNQESAEHTLSGLRPDECSRAMELCWQWMLELPEIIVDLRLFDRECGGRGQTPELMIGFALSGHLERSGLKRRAKFVESFVRSMRRAK